MHRIILPLSLIFLLFSCGGGNKKNLEKIKVQLVSEGPLYGGSNTATGKWKAPSMAKVHSAKITAASLYSADTSLNGLAANVVLQVAAAETQMKKIAFFKGNAGAGSLKLSLAEDQKGMEEFFKGQEITFVADFDLLPEEYAGNLSFTLEFDAELTTD